jgi:hypothetical protein
VLRITGVCDPCALLGLNIMAKKISSYQALLRDPMWQKKRLKILESKNFTCEMCNDNKTELHVHHKKYDEGINPWEYEDDNFMILCKHCHKNFFLLDIKNPGNTTFIKKYSWEDDNRFILFIYHKEILMIDIWRNDRSVGYFMLGLKDIWEIKDCMNQIFDQI